MGSWSKALLELTSDKRIWPGSTQEERLSQAYSDYSSMCKAQNVRLFAEFEIMGFRVRF